MAQLAGSTLRKLALLLGAIMALLIVFAYLTGVSKMDVTLKHDMTRHVVAESFEAGDVVALSPDGQRLGGFLCDINPPADRVADISIKARYYNVVDASQDSFFRFVNRAKAVVGLGEETSPDIARSIDGVPFVGSVNRVVGRFEDLMTTDCLCAVAEAVLERKQTACVVEKALLESTLSTTPDGNTVLSRTVGLSFREDPILVRNPDTLAEFCPGLNTAAIPPANQSCAGRSGVSFDSLARVRAGLIREAPLD
jgi:hypothetical protein